LNRRVMNIFKRQKSLTFKRNLNRHLSLFSP
jgi:hypothetical protein